MDKKKKLILGVILLVALTQTVQAERLYTFGLAKDIAIQNNCLQSYDHMQYCYSSKGYFDVYRDGLHQGRFSFGLFGNINGSPEKKLMSDFDWSWEIVEQTEEKISLRGTSNFQPFPWTMDLNIGRYSPLKITHIVKNNTPTPATEVQLFYLVDVNQENNPFVYYQKNDGTTYAYDYSQQKHFTQADTNFAEYQDKVSFGNFSFFYNDIIENGFFITKAYFGNMQQLDASLPDTNGFLLGFSKGSQTIPAGQTVQADPTVSSSETKSLGWIRYQNGACGAGCTVGTPALGDSYLNTGFSSNGANYWWYRSFIAFDLPSTSNHFVKATLYLDFDSTDIVDDTCDFDLNSISDFNADGSELTTADWDTATFEKVIDNWYDETLAADISGDVTNAWNNAILGNRTYLDFKIGMDNEPTYTDPNDKCYVIFFNGQPLGNDPYIEYNWNFDANVTDLNGLEYINQETDGNQMISFDVYSADQNNLFADIYYSSNKGGFENLIIGDFNLWNAGNRVDAKYIAVDANCEWDNVGFQSAKKCYFDWNVLNLADGNYFIDLNIHSTVESDLNYATSGTESIQFDTTAPSTSWDGNHNTWQFVDSNITLTCVDLSQCSTTQFEIDSDSSIFITWGTTQSGTSVNIPEGGSNDGNWAVRFRSTDVTSNTGDWNKFFVLIDRTAPTVSSFTPDTNSTTTDTTPSFQVEFTDSFTSFAGVSTCDYNIYIDRILTQNGTETAFSGICSTSLTTDLTEGQEANIEWEATDAVGNRSGRQIGYPYTYNAPTPPTVGGGGGTSRTAQYLNFILREPVNKSVNVLLLIGTKEEFEIKVKNDAEQGIVLQTYVDENLSQIVECETMIEVGKAEIGTINCTADATDLNAVSLQQVYEGKITVKTDTMTDEVITKVIVFESGQLGALSVLIKENTAYFAGAVVIMIAAATLSFLGVVGTIKNKAGQLIATFGGGSIAFFTLMLIII